MALKSSSLASHPPANPKLGPAIAHFAEAPGRERREELLENLMAGPLLIAIRELPEVLEPSESEGGRVRFVTAESHDAGRVVCGFSSSRSLSALAPAAVALAVDPASLLDWIVATGMEGLLLDPQGPSAFISHDDARQVLGLPPRARGARRAISLRNGSETAIREALERLLEHGSPEAHAIVRETRTGKSVLFARAEDDALRMVLNSAALAQDERERARMLFDELAGHAEDLPQVEGGTAEPEERADLQALFSGDANRPARAAIKVFTWVFGFQPGFELGIDEASTPPRSGG
jgi:hypothetical protein